LILTTTGILCAQTTPARSLGDLVLSEIPALEAVPDLAAWRNSHPTEHLKNAAYDNEYETQGLWCASSAADFSLNDGLKVTRQAFFYVPVDKTSDPLPAHRDAILSRRCRLLALWYQVDNPVQSASLAQSVSADIGASLGSPDEPPRFKRTDGDWDSGDWTPYKVWANANRRVILAIDPGLPGADAAAHTRLLVIARSSQAPRGLSFDWSGDAPKGQPPLNAGLPVALPKNAEITRVGRAENPCSFDDGHNNWQPGLVRFGEKLLQDFPASRWAPYIHLTLARTYAASLLLTYPGIDLDGANKPGDPDALRRNAIAHFRAFLAGNRESPEAPSAWREAWRLLAGLPPSPIHFACTD
jgi:hypothetical protein